MWTPDVYQGAPAPVTGFIATVSKGAVFAVLLRYAVMSDVLSNASIALGISIIAVGSMIVGNLLALLEKNIKRILAFSSIAHVGYLLIALLVVAALDDPEIARETMMVYLAGYFLMTLAAFGVISALSISASDQDTEQLADYRGLFWSHPVLAAVLTSAALSLAGIPLTMGFIAKFYLFAAGVQGALWVLLWALVNGSAIGIYYYLRIVFTMTQSEPTDGSVRANAIPVETIVTVGVLGAAVILFGVYPTPLIELVRGLIGAFGA
jgi:NADH-quinone oxidoreductase subunit N